MGNFASKTSRHGNDRPREECNLVKHSTAAGLCELASLDATMRDFGLSANTLQSDVVVKLDLQNVRLVRLAQELLCRDQALRTIDLGNLDEVSRFYQNRQEIIEQLLQNLDVPA